MFAFESKALKENKPWNKIKTKINRDFALATDKKTETYPKLKIKEDFSFFLCADFKIVFAHFLNTSRLIEIEQEAKIEK